jgi:two-component system CheB/CheR fusion protein
MAKKQHTHLPKVPQDFMVIGIGASAGGIEAFISFIRAIPKNTGMAYVVVLHLHPNHESQLPEILSRVSEIPVHEITDDINLVPDNIYIIPENKILLSVDGVLKLEPRNLELVQNLSIDIFFKSLAETHLNNAVGVLLSGMGSDGTLGLKAIKKFGGITFAQDLASATFQHMPQHAIDAETVDFILPPEEIPAQLIKIKKAIEENFANDEDSSVPLSYEEVLKEILLLVRHRKGIDFSYYKEPTLRRRIARRIGVCRCVDIGSYFEYLKNNPDEITILLKDFLIPVTSFFRDTKTFQNLAKVVFPRLLAGRSLHDPIRLWVAGCSSGEEAYSLAISLFEFFTDKSSPIKIQIFATDISESNIDKARTGIYNALDVQAIPPHLLKTYFNQVENGSYQVNKLVRDTCVFAEHNFLKDPPFSRIDLISCRNVLIYMSTFLQKKAFTSFHYALKETGTLWLGKSETTSIVPDLYSLISTNDKFFSRKYASTNRNIHASSFRGNGDEKHSINTNAISPPTLSQSDFQKKANEILLKQFTPPSVIVSNQYDIIHFSGDTSFYLALMAGKASFNVLKMIRKDLAFDLRNLLQKAQIRKETVGKDDILIKQDNETYLINIQVIPIVDSALTHYLIVFPKKTLLRVEPTLSKKDLAKSNKDLVHLHIHQLEKELGQTRQDIINSAEHQDTTNEELQSTNEELLSSTEELQTLNEELETSKEELQSGNEELTSVNQELINRQKNLNQAHVKLEELNAILVVQNKALEEAQALGKIGAWEIDFATNKVTWSKETYLMYGYEPNEMPIDAETLAGVHPDDIAHMNERINYSRMTGEKFEAEYRRYDKAGKIIYIFSRGNVKKDSDNTITGMLCISMDVTELREHEQKLKDAYQQVAINNLELERSNAELAAFSYIASHDLQEPLRKIQTFIQRILEKETVPETMQDYFDRIVKATKRMKSLLSDLLSYSGMNTGDQGFVLTDLNTLLEEARNSLSDRIDESNAVIDASPLPTLPVIPTQFYQVFLNLLSNAIKYSKPTENPLIVIVATLLSGSEIDDERAIARQKYWKLSFADNGIGIEKEYENKIFEPFQRLHSKSDYEGTGIGLTICRKVVQNHNGFIKVVSQIGMGSVFYIYLPLG